MYWKVSILPGVLVIDYGGDFDWKHFNFLCNINLTVEWLLLLQQENKPWNVNRVVWKNHNQSTQIHFFFAFYNTQYWWSRHLYTGPAAKLPSRNITGAMMKSLQTICSFSTRMPLLRPHEFLDRTKCPIVFQDPVFSTGSVHHDLWVVFFRQHFWAASRELFIDVYFSLEVIVHSLSAILTSHPFRVTHALTVSLTFITEQYKESPKTKPLQMTQVTLFYIALTHNKEQNINKVTKYRLI